MKSFVTETEISINNQNKILHLFGQQSPIFCSTHKFYNAQTREISIQGEGYYNACAVLNPTVELAVGALTNIYLQAKSNQGHSWLMTAVPSTSACIVISLINLITKILFAHWF